MNRRHDRPERRRLDGRRPAHQPRPRPRAGAWQAFCRARRNAVHRLRPRVRKPLRQPYRQLALGLPVALASRPLPQRAAPPRVPPRRARRQRL